MDYTKRFAVPVLWRTVDGYRKHGHFASVRRSVLTLCQWNELFKEKSGCCLLFQVNTKGKCLRDSRDRVMVLSRVTLMMMLCFERGCPQCHTGGRQLSRAWDCGVTNTCSFWKKKKKKTQIMWRILA